MTPSLTAARRIVVKIGSDFGVRAGDHGEKGGFAGVGLADETDIGDEFEAQPDPAFLAGPAFVSPAGGAVGGGFVARVAEAAVAAAQQGDGFARRVHVRQEGFLVVIENLRADGDFDEQGGRAGACTVRPGAVAALAGAEMLSVAEVDQGVEVLDRLEHDIAAAAAVAAVGAAELDEFLAPEGRDAVTAVAGFEVDFCLVEEFHFFDLLQTKKAGCCRPSSKDCAA